MYAPEPPYCTYGLHVSASCVLYVPEAQGSTHCTYAVRVPASAAPYVPRTVAPQVVAQGKLIGGLAGILGDDAYTVLSLKNRYLASARKLRETLATRGAPPPPEASSSLDDMATMPS